MFVVEFIVTFLKGHNLEGLCVPQTLEFACEVGMNTWIDACDGKILLDYPSNKPKRIDVTNKYIVGYRTGLFTISVDTCIKDAHAS